MIWTASLLFATLLALGREPQDKGAQQAPLIKTNVHQVVVPVVVVDKKRHYVRGLQASAFSVFEDGRPQKIVAFQGPASNQSSVDIRLTMGSRNAAEKPPSRSVAPRRTYLVCIDTLHSSIGNFSGARKALVKFFRREHDDEAQYVLISLGRDVQVIQDSTREPSTILAALESKKFLSSVQNSEATSIAFDTERLRRLLEPVSGTACKEVSDRCEGVKRQVRSIINNSAERTSVLTRAFLAGLKSVIQITAQMPTEKTLILVSDGFNLIPGRELYAVAAAHFLEEAEWQFNERDTQVYLNDLLKIAQKYNVVVDSLNSRGLYSLVSSGSTYDAASSGQGIMRMGEAQNKMDSLDAQVSWENESAMAQLADATGGTYFHNNNDLGIGLRKAFDDSRDSYTLAYVPPKEEADNRFHKIKVVLKDSSLQVKAKSGYWATAP